MSYSTCINCRSMVSMYEKYCTKCKSTYNLKQDPDWHKGIYKTGYDVFAEINKDSTIPNQEVSDEYIRDKIGMIIDQTRFHDVRLDHILKQKEDLTDELVEEFKALKPKT